MARTLREALDADAPPDWLDPPRQALWWLKKDGFAAGPGWERAHAICQEREGDRAHDLVHGLAHLVEGDVGNADYWCRRAGWRRASDDPATEWERLVDELDD